MTHKISVIVPARNEEACIGQTVKAIFAAAKECRQHDSTVPVEVLVVDNLSTDLTATKANRIFDQENSFDSKLVLGSRLSAPCARNDGVAISSGNILVFVDADTVVPKNALLIVLKHVRAGKLAGISRYRSLEPGKRAWCWWTFWNCVRLLPIAKAKAMSAFMFCTREVFNQFGPFDETVTVGEEWPILAGMYQKRRSEFVYDQSLVVGSSSRRMSQIRFGYLRTLAKWVWAVLHVSGRKEYRADIR